MSIASGREQVPKLRAAEQETGGTGFWHWAGHEVAELSLRGEVCFQKVSEGPG